MTTDPNEPRPDTVDELTGRWFDSEPDHIESAGAAEEVRANLDTEQARRAAGLQLVHSLLIQLSHRDKEERERQIRTLMDRITEETPGHEVRPAISHHVVRRFVRYGIAAAIIISISVVVTQTPSNTATAAMAQMIAAMDQAGDRTYSICVEGHRGDRRPPRDDRVGPPPQPRDRPGRPDPPPPERQRGPGERAVLDGSTLYLRGTDQFVLFRPTPSGRTLINGGDGRTRWMIRPEKPVLVSSDPGAFPIPMPEELAALVSLDLKATLQRIQEHYRVKRREESPPDGTQDGATLYLDAEKVSRGFHGPKNIELWSEAETGLLLRIEFADIPLEDYPFPVRLIIELTSQTPLADNWFTRQAHHAEDAEVYDVSADPDELGQPL